MQQIQQTTHHKIHPHLHISSISCHSKDVRVATIRRTKYFRDVKQFNEDETIPNHLVHHFFKNIKKAKMLKSFNLKWSYLPDLHTRPEIMYTICKHQGRNLSSLDVLVMFLILPYTYQNLLVPLKNLKTLVLETQAKDIRKLPALRSMENLYLDLRYGKIDYNLLCRAICRLTKLKKVHILTVPRAVAETVSLMHRVQSAFSTSKPIEFEIATKGEKEYSLLSNQDIHREMCLTKINFQAIQTTQFLENLFAQSQIYLKSLKSLQLAIKSSEPNIFNSLNSLSTLPQLEDLTIDATETKQDTFSTFFIREFRLPPTLKSLNIKGNFSLSDVVAKPVASTPYSWRSTNIFETDPGYLGFLQSFQNAKSLERLTFQFDLLDYMNPLYTNFFIAIINRIPGLAAIKVLLKTDFEARKGNIDLQESQEEFFDLNLFLKACSRLKFLKEIQLCMPHYFFDETFESVEFPSLQTIVVRAFENEKKEVAKYRNLAKATEKLLKILSKNAGNLAIFGIEWNEVLTQTDLLRRFVLLSQFKNLRTICGNFSVQECDENIVKGLGRIIKSMVRLENLSLKFTESDSSFSKLQDFLKYHKSIKNILVYFDKMGWLDNDCLVNPLNCELKELDFDDSFYFDETDSMGDIEEEEDEEGEEFDDFFALAAV